MARFYLTIRRDHPHQGKHNALQRLTYFALPFLAAAAVMTGLAIWKPVQLSGLTAVLGGFVWARFWHFLVMLLLVALTFGHVFMVFAVDPYSLRAIVTGGYDLSRSPERRNARPFVHLFSAPASPAHAAAPATPDPTAPPDQEAPSSVTAAPSKPPGESP
jgi:hypothetical protein